ncbi:MAG: NAD-dependent deacylase [Candidatus Krumholzibacteria bacterium]|nr:NAD-dependent deacylase [Candidatus Krumholzibacteria bacterium]MDH4335944.1 NAD-dependent deacylase [Candidatus Krumholzibacteria bacterium]MDH5268480.1 NAD-dependent deacylase [Candidatus Krumholzibacteria bacterium]
MSTHPGMDEAIDILAGARRVVVTTGAGMSRESGVPTFRDAPNALWADYNPEDLATRAGFARDPALVWRWYAERRRMIAETTPHAGHRAIARMPRLFDGFLLLTQNIDNLHTTAGSSDVVELHGNIFRFKCFENGHPATPDEGAGEPPRCQCGSFLRPDVVWFGEMLDPHHIDRAYAALATCDAILVVGTSGLVYPAAGFPAVARDAGARVVEVNPEPSGVTPIADVFVRAGARDTLPLLVDALERLRGGR